QVMVAPLLVWPAAVTFEITAGLLVLATVTATLPAVVTLPAASAARALSVWLPFGTVVVSQVNVNGAVVRGEPRSAPSSVSCTLATPTLSLAVAVTFTEVPDTDAPAAGAVRLTVGGCASSEPPTWPRYADSGVLEKVGPTVKVAGRLVRLVCELVTFRVPLLVSRKNIVP